MKMNERRALAKKLNDGVQKSGFSARIYNRSFTATSMNLIRQITNELLPEGYRLVLQDDYGYTKDDSCYMRLFTVVNIETDERVVDANVNEYPAGPIYDHWKIYDCTCIFVARQPLNTGDAIFA